jgi:hypothetical protein
VKVTLNKSAKMAQFGAFYTDNLGAPLRIAQVVGLTSTAFLTGQAAIAIQAHGLRHDR